MERLQNPEKLQEYTSKFRYYVNEYKCIESNIIHLYDVLPDLDMRNINQQVNQVREYIAILQEMCVVMEETAQELEGIAKCYYEVSGPLGFNFISIIDIKTWWEQAYPIIEQIATVTGAITGVAAITATPVAFIKWVRNKLQQRQEKNEYKWIRFILQENEWNISILSQKLGLSEDETKKILRGFGYIWDAKKMLYIATENTYKLRNIKI